jgi:hypothetical protein
VRTEDGSWVSQGSSFPERPSIFHFGLIWVLILFIIRTLKTQRARVDHNSELTNV